MPTDPLVGPLIAAATTATTKLAPDVEHRREDADYIHDNRANLETEVGLLRGRTKDIMEEIEEGEAAEMKKMTNECGEWLDRVPVRIERAQELEADYQKFKRYHYIMKWFYSKAKLSRKMKKKADEIASLRDKMTPDKAMKYKAPMMPLPRSSEEIDKSPWIKRNVDDIWSRLQDKGLKKIGIHAFMGMGKTTIMNSLHDKACKDREIFKPPIFITVQDNDNEETIQKRIIEQLNIDVKEIPSPNLFADTISRALQHKKYLLLMDQLAQKIDLKKLGIRDDHSTGRVVVAAREKHVCEDMGMQESIPIIMYNNDAWYMFRQIAGEVADRTKIKPYARLIAKECGNNPSLIKAVAVHLNRRGENEEIWWDCKVKLQSCRDHYIQNFDDAYNAFTFLFEQLNDSRKGCFLYGALFPQNHEIYADYLMECWRAEEFIPLAGCSNDQQIFRRARGDGHHAMEHLIDGCLLERTTRAKYVKMPPLFRKWAFRTGDGVKMLVGLSDEEIRNYPAANDRGDRTRISLNCKNLRKMLEGVSLQKISTLLLQRSETFDIIQLLDLISICESQLRVLDLGYTGITSVPSSISKLTRLKALYLNDCPGLRTLPIKIEELTNLEALDISRSGIPSWPSVIGNLSNLKCFRVSFTENVVNSNQTTVMNAVPCASSSSKKAFSRDHTAVQPANIIYGLRQLEELTIFVDERSLSWRDGVAETIVEELVKLEFLTTLRFYFPTLDHLTRFINESVSWRNGEPFRSFKIVVGSFQEANTIDMSGYKAEQHLKVFASDEPLEAISPILRQAHTFELIGHQIIEHLAGLGIENMTGLKICAVQGCPAMRSIIRTDNNTGAVALPELERLHLFNLTNLVTVSEGQLGRGSFVNLTTLTIRSCPVLRVILPFELARHAPQLVHLRVENCLQARAIMECEEPPRERVTALDSNLKKLELINLPNLQWIGHRIVLMWPALQELEVDECDGLLDFPSVVSDAMRLTWFRCKHSLWNQLSEECRSRPHLSHSAIGQPYPVNNPPQVPGVAVLQPRQSSTVRPSWFPLRIHRRRSTGMA